MRLPNPPRGSVSWFGKKRSYDFIPISDRRDIASVSTYEASCRAALAGTTTAKKNHACAPFPDRDRSIATGNPTAQAVERTKDGEFRDFYTGVEAVAHGRYDMLLVTLEKSAQQKEHLILAPDRRLEPANPRADARRDGRARGPTWVASRRRWRGSSSSSMTR